MRLIVLVGGSGTGKSTLARGLQQRLLPAQWLHFSADTLLDCFPAATQALANQHNDWSHVDARRLTRNAHAWLRVLLDAGHHVIFDCVVMTARGGRALQETLRADDAACLIELRCAWDETARRTLARGDRTLAEAEHGFQTSGLHLPAPHRIDTTGLNPEAVVQAAMAVLARQPEAAAAAPIVLRNAVAGDHVCLGVLATQVFLDTYATQGIDLDLAQEALGVLSPAAFAARIAEASSAITLAEAAGKLVGFLDLSLQADCTAPGICGPEVLRLYIQPPFQRQGLGRRLLAQAEARARSGGAAHLWLTAWCGNRRALAFYADLGFADVGNTHYVIAGKRYENRVLAKPLPR